MIEDHQGQVPKGKRESDQLREHRLFLKLYEAMREARDAGSTDIGDLALAATQALLQSPKRLVALELLRACSYKPTCHICGLRIFLDVVEAADPSRLSIDHLKRRADGGRWEVDNCLPAHQYCNSIRHALELGTLRPRVRRKHQALQEQIRARMEQETLDKSEDSCHTSPEREDKYGNSW